MFFALPARRTSREIAIQLALTAEGHEVRIVAKPDLTGDVGDDLRHRLESVPAPKVGGPVKLNYIITVWGASEK